MNVKQSSQVKNSSTQVDFVVMTKAVAKLGQKRINEIAEWANPRGFPLSGALAAELEYLADRARWPREKRPGPAHGGRVRITLSWIADRRGLAALDGRPIEDDEVAALLGLSLEGWKRLSRHAPMDSLEFDSRRVSNFKKRAEFAYQIGA